MTTIASVQAVAARAISRTGTPRAGGAIAADALPAARKTGLVLDISSGADWLEVASSLATAAATNPLDQALAAEHVKAAELNRIFAEGAFERALLSLRDENPKFRAKAIREGMAHLRAAAEHLNAAAPEGAEQLAGSGLLTPDDGKAGSATFGDTDSLLVSNLKFELEFLFNLGSALLEHERTGDAGKLGNRLKTLKTLADAFLKTVADALDALREKGVPADDPGVKALKSFHKRFTALSDTIGGVLDAGIVGPAGKGQFEAQSELAQAAEHARVAGELLSDFGVTIDTASLG